MSLLGIIGWIVVGIIVGAIATVIYPGHQRGGWFSAVIWGIVGSFIGGTW
ncbi:MAG: hypothetical protein AAF773_10310 [Cyanobacteria bacterium P01_D01_bin.115]